MINEEDSIESRSQTTLAATEIIKSLTFSLKGVFWSQS